MDAYLSTNPDDFCFIDTETLSSADLLATGVYPYSASPDFRVMIVTYAIGDGPVKIWKQEAAHAGGWLDWMEAPDDLWAFSERVDRGEAWFVAWNAAFDRLALSRGVRDGNWIRPQHFLDAMAQAVRAHLPPDLAGAGAMARTAIKKRSNGKDLIKLFSLPPFASPQERPEEWGQFCEYALDDIPPMREVWYGTPPLTRDEWRQYWASEVVNDNGMPVDRAFVEDAAQYAEENERRANADIARLTGGKLYSVAQNEALCTWVLDHISDLSVAKEILLREIVEDPTGEGDDVKRLEKYSLERSRVEDLLAFFDRLSEKRPLTETEKLVVEVLNVRAYGASATPKKFVKMIPMLGDDDRLRGQYVFNGAAATGRFSSRGLQIHNLTRATVGSQVEELAVIDMIQDRVPYEVLAEMGPVGKTLSRLIRPSFVAPDGQMMLWSDYSAIEARVLPWLGESFGAGPVLDIFRENDADPSLPDIYRVQAGKILGKDAREVTKKERQSHGKVPVLSLGFGGGKGALFAMARNYGASFAEEEATEIVSNWRAANPWARAYWDATWSAVIECMHNPSQPTQVGSRLTYMYEAGLMGGTMICILPCGRPLLYPSIRWEEREKKDRTTGKTTTEEALTYRRGRNRAPLWYGTFVENAVQAVAGSLLRHAITRLVEEQPQLVVGHTHDEIIACVNAQDVAAGREVLETAMLDLPAWAEGLPVAAEATESRYYTKTLD